MAVTNFDTMNGEMIAEYTGTTQLDYLTDALGSVTGVCDQTGSLVGSTRYKPYGTTLSSSGTQATFTWVGSLGYRPTTLTYSNFYVRARHYGSNEGMWTSKDRLWPHQGSFNYVNANPTSFTDVSGMQSDAGVVVAPGLAGLWGAIAAGSQAGGVLGEGCEPVGGAVPGAIIGVIVGTLAWLMLSQVPQPDETARRQQKAREKFRRTPHYRNCKALQLACRANAALRPVTWQPWAWNAYCDSCYLKCLNSGIAASIFSGCNFWDILLQQSPTTTFPPLTPGDIGTILGG